ncbi:T-cell surface glycoprotein CD3 epsilon chain-like [Stegastes partitus]|uniref:T-cell surface glycoprotein CD3 epsilon chain-like n=1 Tax=Stegastes partitus TaxID=144197 RepID=A0A3B5AQE9_9TELE|nr:PREDICTED: T-cell surface glycoprotein CD3 epsilon chain-like [Stegastes partitus]
MHSMAVQAVLAVVLLLFTATVMSAEGGISFWRTKVTMTCPEEGTWHQNKGQQNSEDKGANASNKKQHEMEYDSIINYRCDYDEPDGGSTGKKYYFYAEGKVCKDCFELDSQLVLLVIIADVLGTICLIAIMYNCSKKKGSAGPAPSSRAPARQRGRDPPGTSSDYEPLNRSTVAQGTYSVVNRTG